MKLEENGFKDEWVPDDRYHCVSCEHVDYTPVTLEELGIER
jgi:hypothetical protein